jgi:hypothetical protein
MKFSLRMRAVNEIDTMCRNSFSTSTRDMIMIAAPSGGYVIKIEKDETAVKKRKTDLGRD